MEARRPLRVRRALRPVVPTGTNLLGLVKHVASVEAGYPGATFGRPFSEPLPWLRRTTLNPTRTCGCLHRIEL